MNKKGNILDFIGTWIMPILLVIAFLIVMGFLIAEPDPCDSIEGCLEYKCRSDAADWVDWKTHYAIQYQNCLLEEQRGSLT